MTMPDHVRASQDLLQHHNVLILPWRASSQDLNTIECLWDKPDQLVCRRNPPLSLHFGNLLRPCSTSGRTFHVLCGAVTSSHQPRWPLMSHICLRTFQVHSQILFLTSPSHGILIYVCIICTNFAHTHTHTHTSTGAFQSPERERERVPNGEPIKLFLVPASAPQLV